MATVINNPGGNGSGEGSGVGVIVGVLIAIVLIVLFFVYALPAFRGAEAPAVPDTVDLDVNFPNPGDIVPAPAPAE